MTLLLLCLFFGMGRTQKIEAAVQNAPESRAEESRLDIVGTDREKQETERAAVREKKEQQ